jgi:Mn2+/Fe2+ NRAMP family transporter
MAGWIHAVTLALAAAVVLLPGIPPAKIALWAQASSGLFMPFSLFFLAWIAVRSRDMGPMRMHLRRTVLFAAIILAFIALGLWTALGVL